MIEELAFVYHNDADTRERGLSPEDRLAFHREHSGPVMERLREQALKRVILRRKNSLF